MNLKNILGQVDSNHYRHLGCRPFCVVALATNSWHYDAVWEGGNHPISTLLSTLMDVLSA
ncbi:hypothetical protein [Sphingobium tyrosinilyticum]|uniref:hypothetical protein n=1 Tax=Sphingobium tyrosinilyticum TaxID=2715436 RepID=UPI0036D2B1A3